MTKINRLVLHGFKSFAHKTEIPFDNTYNCILGSNGSGKSNVSDALCFVLGRISARSLRAEKTANLIFNGGKKKKPGSSAYVEIAFCNEKEIFPQEEKEVVIRRTVSKKGTSTYHINGKKVTRTNVVDLLAIAKINPNGYNIIAQGDVTRFVDMSPLERRKIIEQISDISHYEEKKHKAVLELNKVEEQLQNINIILKERKTHLNNLKKDRDQALKYKEVKDNIDDHKATLLDMQIKEKSAEKEKHEEKVSGMQEKISKAQEEITQLKTLIEEKKQEIQKINSEIEEKGEKEQVRVHKEIEELKVGVAKDKTRISTLEEELKKIAQRKQQFKIELEELETKCSNHTTKQKEIEQTIALRKKEIAELEGKIAQFKKKHNMESSAEIEKEIEEKDKVIEEQQEKIQQIRAEQQEILRAKDKIEYQLQTIDERIEKVKAVAQEHKEQIKALQETKKKFKQITLKLNETLNKDGSFAAQLANAKRNVVSLQEEHAKLHAKSMSAQAQAANNRAVATLLENKRKFKGVYGTVAELGQVNKKYALPLQTAAGAKMQNVVVESDQVAKECIEFLRKEKVGSASFIPLNRIRHARISPEDQKLTSKQGVHDFALNLISFDPRYKSAFAYVFGNTLIVDDIRTAQNVGIGKIRMATLEGSTVEASGVMRGGFVNTKRVAGFKERDSLEKQEKLEAEIRQLQSTIANIQKKRAENEEDINNLRKEKSELEGEIIKEEKALHLDTSDLEANADLKKELKEELKEVESKEREIQRKISAVNRELAQVKSKRHMLKSQITSARSPTIVAQLSAYEETKQKYREEILRLESDLRNAKSNMQELIGPEREKIAEIMKQHEKEEETFGHEVKELSSRVSVQEKDLVEKEKQSKAFYAQYKELFSQRDKISQIISNKESAIERLRESMHNQEQQVNLVSLKNAEIKAKLAALEEEFIRYKDAKILEGKELKQLQQEVARFEVVLAQMSAVNMKALEIYEKVEEEYNKLTEKHDSLAQEKTEVHTLMNEIETKKTEHFMKTFSLANDNFKRIFSNLFRKGNAYLELENPKDVFEGGIDIKVKITGNRYMDIKSLSGGEKTMTALSFIFAIQEHDPASFYILDEIDAALDKHNAETLAKMVRSYCDGAQYIVISHNDAVISEADTLFGVSMTEGISKVTSLKL